MHIYFQKIMAITISIIIFATLWSGLGLIVERYIDQTSWIMLCGVFVWKTADEISGIVLESLWGAINER